MKERSKHPREHGLWIAPASAPKAAAEINEQRKRNGEQLLDAAELLNLCTRPSIFVWNPMALLRVFSSSATFLVCGGHTMAASSTDDIPTQLAAVFGYPFERIRITE